MLNSIRDIPYCEVFYPSWSEFQDFSGYLDKVSLIAKSGIFKVFNGFLIFLGSSSVRLEGTQGQLRKTGVRNSSSNRTDCHRKRWILRALFATKRIQITFKICKTS